MPSDPCCPIFFGFEIISIDAGREQPDAWARKTEAADLAQQAIICLRVSGSMKDYCVVQFKIIWI